MPRSVAASLVSFAISSVVIASSGCFPSSSASASRRPASGMSTSSFEAVDATTVAAGAEREPAGTVGASIRPMFPASSRSTSAKHPGCPSAGYASAASAPPRHRTRPQAGLTVPSMAGAQPASGRIAVASASVLFASTPAAAAAKPNRQASVFTVLFDIFAVSPEANVRIAAGPLPQSRT